MNTHRIDVWEGQPPVWVEVDEVASLTIALNQAARLYATARVVELTTNHVIAEWRDGQRVG
jgi:hypothetical protein